MDGTVSPPAGGSRTGRNLPAAIISAVGLAVLIIGSLYTFKPAFLVVVIAAVGVGIHELVKGLATRDIRVPLIPVLVGLAAMVAGAYEYGPGVFLGIFAITVMGVLGWRLFQGSDGFVRDATATVFMVVYPAMFAGFVGLLLAPDDGAHRALIFVAVTASSDIGGYAAGVLFGKHPMSIISPKKTWEGFAGSAIACIAVGGWLVTWLLKGAIWQGALLGAVVVVCATIGDLIESVIKRDLGIKDMGSVLPGHGGMMDRIDSLLFTLVPCWLLLAAFIR
ncbi:phosphatidate cytidylyltransferase [Herbidospora mongoliensis]|uniref:phosphatidate cytidylyltransferase n=1 Tax=Herbidospora mongoliensis TaxID=688067 RepID=UPI001FDECBE1|nr:phosphatidate cytidylyltransferase [Herbidospora mongoliensis]